MLRRFFIKNDTGKGAKARHKNEQPPNLNNLWGYSQKPKYWGGNHVDASNSILRFTGGLSEQLLRRKQSKSPNNLPEEGAVRTGGSILGGRAFPEADCP